MPTLYRKYRPQTFADVSEQAHIVRTLTNEIALGKIAHAFLFSGPRGVGKTTLARLVAKALNCSERATGKFEPCNHCTSCAEISAGHSLDVIEIDAASQTGVDNVRENIIENARFRPATSPYKIFIIDEVHMLSGSAFNALLKTLEEPPAHVVFILATTELNKLPATIISRCQRFTFKRILSEAMLKRLQSICTEEKVKVDTEVLERIIAKSDGCLRDAESLLGQILSLNLKKITAEDVELVLPIIRLDIALDFVTHLVDSATAPALAVLNSLTDEGLSWEQFTDECLEILRCLLITQSGQQPTQFKNFDQKTIDKIKQTATHIQPAKLIWLINLTLKRRQEIRLSPVPQLPLELLAVEAGVDQQPYEPTKPSSSPAASSSPSSNTPTEKPARHLASTVKTALSNITHQPLKATLEDVQTKWPELIEKISAITPSLTFILKMCAPLAIERHLVKITSLYSFHKEKIEEQKNRKLIEDCLSELLGERAALACVIAENSLPTTTPDSEAQTIATEFGGEVVG